jgi:F-type H+-transporting ATPase subunit epsilon
VERKTSARVELFRFGHAPIVSLLRLGIVTAIASASRDRFVVLGGVAEFSNETLTIPAESAAHVESTILTSKIAAMEDGLKTLSVGQEIDAALAKLDHYKAVYNGLTLTTAL